MGGAGRIGEKDLSKQPEGNCAIINSAQFCVPNQKSRQPVVVEYNKGHGGWEGKLSKKTFRRDPPVMLAQR